MTHFDRIWERACARHGEAEVRRRLPRVKDAAALARVADDRYLSDMARRIFRAGLKHALVDAKWPAFEEVFWGFDPARVRLMSDEQLERLTRDDRLIRHWGKLKAVRVNALMVWEIAQAEGSFAAYIAGWPGPEIVGLWRELQRRGAHLGGQSAAAFLRMVGKDTFRLTPDVLVALNAAGVVERAPTAQRDLLRVQAAFNEWQQQCGRPLAHISQCLALSQGEA